jgi:sporulation protein YunB
LRPRGAFCWNGSLPALRLSALRLPALRWPRGGGHAQQKHRARTLVLLTLFLAASVGGCAVLERRASPQIHALAETVAKQQASAAISAAVEDVLVEEQVTYDRLVQYSGADGIRSIKTNTREINLIRAKINDAVEQAVDFRHGRLRLPLGALMGSELMAGAGPNVVVPLTMTGHALSNIRSELDSGGVNQTMHRILMDLTVSISVILPGGADTSEIEMTVCLAETVIVGTVPNGIITQK